MPSGSIRLKVDGWSNARFATTEGNSVLFEVMSMGCACPTCYARLLTVKNRMQSSKLPWRVDLAKIPEREGETSAVLVVRPESKPERIDSFLSELLGLPIQEIV